MIIKSNRPDVRVGQHVTDGVITDNNGTQHSIPFVILEEVTERDYLNECLLENRIAGLIFDNDRFFRISVD